MMTEQSRGSVFAGILFVSLIVTLGFFIFLKINQVNKQTKQVGPNITTPPPTQTGLFNYETFDDLVSKTLCQAKYTSWNTKIIADTVVVKVPKYLAQNPNVGGQYFEIKSPTYGHLSLFTSLVGDYAPKGITGFEPTLQYLMQSSQSRKDGFSGAKYYKDQNSNYVIVGNTYFIASKSIEQNTKWWMFNLLPASSEKPDDPKNFVQSEDFKCMLRSVTFQ